MGWVAGDGRRLSGIWLRRRALCRDAEPQYCQKVNNGLELYSVGNALFETQTVVNRSWNRYLPELRNELMMCGANPELVKTERGSGKESARHALVGTPIIDRYQRRMVPLEIRAHPRRH